MTSLRGDEVTTGLHWLVNRFIKIFYMDSGFLCTYLMEDIMIENIMKYSVINQFFLVNCDNKFFNMYVN